MKTSKTMQFLLSTLLLLLSSTANAFYESESPTDLGGGWYEDFYESGNDNWYFGDGVSDAVESQEIDAAEVEPVANLEDIVPDEDMEVVVITGQREPTIGVDVVTTSGERIPTLVDLGQFAAITAQIVDNAIRETGESASSNVAQARALAIKVAEAYNEIGSVLRSLNDRCPTNTTSTGAPSISYTMALAMLREAQQLLLQARADLDSALTYYLRALGNNEASPEALDSIHGYIQGGTEELNAYERRLNAALDTCDG